MAKSTGNLVLVDRAARPAHRPAAVRLGLLHRRWPEPVGLRGVGVRRGRRPSSTELQELAGDSGEPQRPARRGPGRAWPTTSTCRGAVHGWRGATAGADAVRYLLDVLKVRAPELPHTVGLGSVGAAARRRRGRRGRARRSSSFGQPLERRGDRHVGLVEVDHPRVDVRRPAHGRGVAEQLGGARRSPGAPSWRARSSSAPAWCWSARSSPSAIATCTVACQVRKSLAVTSRPNSSRMWSLTSQACSGTHRRPSLMAEQPLVGACAAGSAGRRPCTGAGRSGRSRGRRRTCR